MQLRAATRGPLSPLGCRGGPQHWALARVLLVGSLCAWLLQALAFVQGWKLPRHRTAASPEAVRHRRGDEAGPAASVAAAASEDSTPGAEGEAGASDRAELKVTALGGSMGSFLMEMGGQRLLINPNLDESPDLKPENVHDEVDYVILTTAQEEFFHEKTIRRMNLKKVNIVATENAGVRLAEVGLTNLAILSQGAGSQLLLSGGDDKAPIVLKLTPGSEVMPFQSPESGFIIGNLHTGVAVGYEAIGRYCGRDAGAWLGVPEEAYEVDYLVATDLREVAGVAKGLTERGAVLRGIVGLPKPAAFEPVEEAQGVNLALAPLLAMDRAADQVLGGIEDEPEELRKFLAKQGPPLSEIQFWEAKVGEGAIKLE